MTTFALVHKMDRNPFGRCASRMTHTGLASRRNANVCICPHSLFQDATVIMTFEEIVFSKAALEK
jgi:hypothetical protein